MTKAELRALRFVHDHPGGYRVKAFPFGYSYHFDAPELKRPPCRPSTINTLVEERYLDARRNGLHDVERLTLSVKGQAAIAGALKR